jgi:hypothetical protein
LSINWQSGVVPAPTLLVLPPDVDSLEEAHAAIEMWEFYSRKVLDPSQRLAVEVMMAESLGRWAARTTGREMPRQNGKGDELEVVELWGLVQRREAILHTAHELTTVSSAHQRMAGLIMGHADLRRRKRKILNGIGQQLIELTNDGVIAYRTRTNGGGRGLDDISRLVVDEAQHAKPEQLASSTPILLANPNPQMNFAGTGGIAGVSDWWWELRKRALGPAAGQFGYVGHTAEKVWLDDAGRVLQEPVDPEDRDMWFAANPALHAGRGEVEFFEEQMRTLGPALFAREHLGVWDPPPIVAGEGAVDLGVWGELSRDEYHPEGQSKIESHRAWGLAVTPDRRWAALGVAGRRADGVAHVEYMDHRSGTDWIVERVVAAWRARGVPIRIHATAAEGSFIAPLLEAGVEVVEVSSAEVARSTGMMLDSINGRTLRHIDQASLTKSLRIAGLRTSSAGGSIWDDNGGDISPLKAVTVALGGVPQESTASVYEERGMVVL